MTPTRWGLGVVVALVVGLAAAPAQAGTYDVAACNAPGGRGVNNAWTWTVRALDGAPTSEDAANYQLVGSCASPTGLIAQPVVGRRARWGTWAEFGFAAPANTAISKVRLWRHGRGLLPGDDPNTPENDSGRWEVFADYGAGNQIGAESCKPGAGPTPNPCEIGATPFSSRSLNEMVGRAATFTAGIFCGGDNGPFLLCRNGDANGPYAQYEFQGAVVTIQDDTKPTFTPAGGLLSDNWHKVSDATSYDASDNTGIRNAGIALDGNTVGVDNRSCDFTFKVPCAQVRQERSGSPTRSPTGSMTCASPRVDAAGNETAVDRKVAIDGNAPSVSWSARAGATIVLSVSDEASGVASGQIFIRNSSAEPFRPSRRTRGRPSHRGGGSRDSRREPTSASTVSDVAGNSASGAPPRLVVDEHARRAAARAASVATGSGRLPPLRARPGPLDAVGRPAGQRGADRRRRVRSVSPERHAQVIGSTTTSRTGRFSFRVPAGPSRVAALHLPGAAATRCARRVGSGLRVRGVLDHPRLALATLRRRPRPLHRHDAPRRQPHPADRSRAWCCRGTCAATGRRSPTRGRTPAATGAPATGSSGGRAATRSACASGARTASRSTSATRGRCCASGWADSAHDPDAHRASSSRCVRVAVLALHDRLEVVRERREAAAEPIAEVEPPAPISSQRRHRHSITPATCDGKQPDLRVPCRPGPPSSVPVKTIRPRGATRWGRTLSRRPARTLSIASDADRRHVVERKRAVAETHRAWKARPPVVKRKRPRVSVSTRAGDAPAHRDGAGRMTRSIVAWPIGFPSIEVGTPRILDRPPKDTVASQRSRLPTWRRSRHARGPSAPRPLGRPPLRLSIATGSDSVRFPAASIRAT